MNICIIPARGGSKRIPRKNIREFCGKPMIAWSIQAAIYSGCFENIFVSTDNQEIAEIAKSFGAEVPFIRPDDLANEYIGTIPVIVHAIEWLQNQGINPATICCLYATAPFIETTDLQKAKKLIKSLEKNQFVFTGGKFESSIQRALKLNPKSNLCEMVQPENYCKRSQDLKELYFDAGQFYWGSQEAWLTTSNIFEGSKMLLLPKSRVQDIDTPEDWEYAELMHNILNTN